MPIKGLSDRDERFPEIGQIRKGSKKDANGAMGRDLTYFRVEFDERETEAIAMFTKLYGEKPTQLPVMLAFNEVDKVWDAWLEAYTAGRLVARSDGETYQYRVNTKTGEVLTGKGEVIPYVKDEVIGTWVTSSGKNAGKVNEIKCRPVGRLRVVLPDLGRLAYLTVMTTSLHDIMNISSQIQALAMFNGGRIAGIPLILRRSPKEISCPKPDGSRARYSKWMLSIEADPEWVQKSLTVVKALSLPAGATAYLPAPIQNMAANQGPDQDFEDDQDEDDSDIPGVNPDDVQDGQFENVDQPATPPAEKTPIDNNGATRPYEPLVLQRKYGDLVEHFEEKITDPKYKTGYKPEYDTAIPKVIQSVWAGDIRETINLESVFKFLTRETSIKSMTVAQKVALFTWLKIEKDTSGDWSKCKESGIECVKIIDYLDANKKQGQPALI